MTECPYCRAAGPAEPGGKPYARVRCTGCGRAYDVRWEVVEEAPYRKETVASVHGDSPPPSPRLVDISTAERPRHLLIFGRNQGPFVSPRGPFMRYAVLFVAVVFPVGMLIDGTAGRPYATTFAFLLSFFAWIKFVLDTWSHREVWLTERGLSVGRFLGRFGYCAENPIIVISELAVYPADPNKTMDFITDGPCVVVNLKGAGELQLIADYLWLPREQLVWIRDHLTPGLEMVRSDADPMEQMRSQLKSRSRFSRAPRGVADNHSPPPGEARITR